jgi:hypothetical protein
MNVDEMQIGNLRRDQGSPFNTFVFRIRRFPLAKGHIYHFPILTNGTASLRGSRIEPNPHSKREARRFLFGAHNAARSAFGGSQV